MHRGSPHRMLRRILAQQESSLNPRKKKAKKVKLLPHEQTLLDAGLLVEQTHERSTARWLWAPSTAPQDLPDGYTVVYRPMGDLELLHLLENGTLPSSQPYQAIIEGAVGRVYAEKYLWGIKKVDTFPTSVVEFVVPREGLVDVLMAIQHKVEDGAISMGLGDKAGNGLPLFNAALLEGSYLANRSGETKVNYLYLL